MPKEIRGYFREERMDRIKVIKAIEYSKQLGMGKCYMSSLYNGRNPIRLVHAKAIISVCYNIPFRDSRMNELLNYHFIGFEDFLEESEEIKDSEVDLEEQEDTGN